MSLALVIGAMMATDHPATAAITNLTPIVGGGNAGVLGDVAYDDKHGVYLHVYESSRLVVGLFIGADGVPRGQVFTISTNAIISYAGKPQVAYSAGTSDDVFFVTFASDAMLFDRGSNIFGQIVKYTGSGASGGQLVGVNFPVSQMSTSPPATQRPTDIVYNPNLRHFVAIWDDSRGGTDTVARRIDPAGSPIGDDAAVAYGRYAQGGAKIGYDWERRRYLVAYQGVHPDSPPPPAPEITGAWARLLDENLTDISGLLEVSVGGAPMEMNVTYLPERAGFLMYWTAFTGIRDVIGRVIPSSWSGTFDGDVFPLMATSAYAEGAAEGAYNPATRTVLLAAMSSVGLLRGIELSGTGAPQGNSYNLSNIPTSPTGGSFYPCVVRGPSTQWAVHYVVDYNSVWLERFQGTEVSPPGPSFGGGGSPPPPPPPPPGPEVPFPDPPGSDFASGGAMNLLWQHTDGSVTSWQLSGATLAAGVTLTPGRVNDPKWRIVGSGDFNMDGKRDIIFQHDDGWVAVWLMNGATLVESRLLTPNRVGDPAWRIAGAGDFNGDGSTDLIFRHSTQGWIAGWLMNGTVMQTAAALTPAQVPDLNWKIVAVGDLNHDTRPDIVWQHDGTGVVAGWLMNGFTLSSPGIFSPYQLVDPKWKIKAIGDINGDGWADLVWQHETKNWLATTILNGTTIIDSVFLSPGQVNSGWSIVGPK
jgi:hypothetical protein